MISKSKLLAICTVTALFLVVSAPAQAGIGTIKAGIFDQDGNPLPNANVTITANSTPDNIFSEYVTNADGVLVPNGFGFHDFRDGGNLTGPDPLCFIYKDGTGDVLTVLVEKDGYEPTTTTVILDGGSEATPIMTIWFNVTVEKTPNILQTTEGVLLVVGIIAFLGISVFMFMHFDRKSRARKDKSQKRKKRRRK